MSEETINKCIEALDQIVKGVSIYPLVDTLKERDVPVPVDNGGHQMFEGDNWVDFLSGAVTSVRESALEMKRYLCVNDDKSPLRAVFCGIKTKDTYSGDYVTLSSVATDVAEKIHVMDEYDPRHRETNAPERIVDDFIRSANAFLHVYGVLCGQMAYRAITLDSGDDVMSRLGNFKIVEEYVQKITRLHEKTMNMQREEEGEKIT